MQDPLIELRRIFLLRGSVNKAKGGAVAPKYPAQNVDNSVGVLLLFGSKPKFREDLLSESA